MTGHTPREAASGIYGLICASIEAKPDEPLDTSEFPPIKPGEDEATKLVYTPGLVDGIIDGGETDADEVRRVLEAFARGDIDLEALELFLEGVRAISVIDEVLPPMLRDGCAGSIVEPMWTMAQTSDRYEAIKWGIAFGSRSNSDVDDRVDALLMFARHPEFTLFATNALLWHASERPDIPLRLAMLLSYEDMWGRYHLLNQMGRRRELFAEHEVQRELVVRAGEQTLDGRGERSLGRLVDLALLMDVADGDEPLIAGILGTMDGLVQRAASNPFDLDDTHHMLTCYLDLLERMPRSPRRLDALARLDSYLSDVTTCDWHRERYNVSEIEPLARRSSELVDVAADFETLESMIQDEALQRRACRIAERYRKHELAPVLEALLTPDIDDQGLPVRSWTIKTYVSLVGHDARSTLMRMQPLFDIPLPVAESEKDWQATWIRQERRATYARWSVALMEVGDDREAALGARALTSCSSSVRTDVYRALKQSPVLDPELIARSTQAAFGRLTNSSDTDKDDLSGAAGLVLEFGDADMKDWLFGHLERFLPPGQPELKYIWQDPRAQLHRTALDTARDAGTEAAEALLDRARICGDARIRKYMESDDQRRREREEHA